MKIISQFTFSSKLNYLYLLLFSDVNTDTIVVTRQEHFNILKNSPNRKINDQFSFLREQIRKRTKCPDKVKRGIFCFIYFKIIVFD